MIVVTILGYVFYGLCCLWLGSVALFGLLDLILRHPDRPITRKEYTRSGRQEREAERAKAKIKRDYGIDC